MQQLSVADVLSRAADLIEPEGAWIKGDYRKGQCFCALGAIKEAGGYESDHNPAVKVMRDFLHTTWVHEWNDAPERTQAEVVAALRAAAELAKASS